MWKNNLTAYIPAHLIEKKGVVRGVDTCYSEEELINLINCGTKIKHVKRIYKTRNNDGELTRTPRQMIIVTFDGLVIPQYIYIHKVRYEVGPYFQPVVMCFSCLRYGHTAPQ